MPIREPEIATRFGGLATGVWTDERAYGAHLLRVMSMGTNRLTAKTEHCTVVAFPVTNTTEGALFSREGSLGPAWTQLGPPIDVYKKVHTTQLKLRCLFNLPGGVHTRFQFETGAAPFNPHADADSANIMDIISGADLYSEYRLAGVPCRRGLFETVQVWGRVITPPVALFSPATGYPADSTDGSTTWGFLNPTVLTAQTTQAPTWSSTSVTGRVLEFLDANGDTVAARKIARAGPGGFIGSVRAIWVDPLSERQMDRIASFHLAADTPFGVGAISIATDPTPHGLIPAVYHHSWGRPVPDIISDGAGASHAYYTDASRQLARTDYRSYDRSLTEAAAQGYLLTNNFFQGVADVFAYVPTHATEVFCVVQYRLAAAAEVVRAHHRVSVTDGGSSDVVTEVLSEQDPEAELSLVELRVPLSAVTTGKVLRLSLDAFADTELASGRGYEPLSVSFRWESGAAPLVHPFAAIEQSPIVAEQAERVVQSLARAYQDGGIKNLVAASTATTGAGLLAGLIAVQDVVFPAAGAGYVEYYRIPVEIDPDLLALTVGASVRFPAGHTGRVRFILGAVSTVLTFSSASTGEVTGALTAAASGEQTLVIELEKLVGIGTAQLDTIRLTSDRPGTVPVPLDE